MTYILTAETAAKMTAAEVCMMADMDWHGARDEGFRRSEAAVKKIAKIRKQLAAAEKDLADAEIIVKTALAWGAAN